MIKVCKESINEGNYFFEEKKDETSALVVVSSSVMGEKCE